MNNAFVWLISLIAGVTIGLGYFGGLWWTVQRLPHVHRGWHLYFGSLILRTTLALVAFFWLLRWNQWQAVGGAMLGFLAARIVLIALLRPSPSRLMQG